MNVVPCELASPGAPQKRRSDAGRTRRLSRAHAVAVACLDSTDPWSEQRLLHQTGAWEAASKGARHLLATVRPYLADKAEACPSQEHLARVMGCSARSIRNWTRELERLGLLRTRIVEPGEMNAMGQRAKLQNVHYSMGPVLRAVAERAAKYAAQRRDQELATDRAEHVARLEEDRRRHAEELARRPKAMDRPKAAERVRLEDAAMLAHIGEAQPRNGIPQESTAAKGVKPKEEALTSLSLSDPSSLPPPPPDPSNLSLAKAGEGTALAAQSERGSDSREEPEKARSRERQRLALDVVLHHQRTHYPEEAPTVPQGGVSLVLSRMDEGFGPQFLKDASEGAFRAVGPRSVAWMFGAQHALSAHEHFYRMTLEAAAAEHKRRQRGKLDQERPEDVRAVLREALRPPPEVAPELRRAPAQEPPLIEAAKVEPFKRWEPSAAPAVLPDWLRKLVPQ